ncbi:MAG: restriction endonuclease [Alphaproteobacteria bacterium]|nr:restriction endonuclease [Alphaproteobacteria bacterium]
MMSLDQIRDFCAEHDYDIKKSGNGRWIDQKCTPDVVWSISDFVLNFIEEHGDDTTFTVRDIWNSEYAQKTIADTYSKPNVAAEAAENEYDKVFAQPLSMLCNAGVIEDISPNNRHLYKVIRKDVLEFIAKNDLNSLRFLQFYIENTMKQSGLWEHFAHFFEQQDTQSFSALKNSFIAFYHRHTPIQGDYEPKRIFTKVLNPLALKYQKKGTEKGRLSPQVINRSDLMYNRDNFRDVYKEKPKGMTRQDWLLAHPEIDIRKGYFEQMMSKAKKTLRDSIKEHRNEMSELTNFNAGHGDNAPARQIHHIFPKNEFPEIMHYIENLIALTPNQHYGFAHPNNNTQIVDLEAQKELLIAKTCSIQHNLTGGVEEPIYDFYNFLFVLKTGWDDDSVLTIQKNDYMDIVHTINAHYAAVI